MEKKLLGILFCGILILGLTGCGKEEKHEANYEGLTPLTFNIIERIKDEVLDSDDNNKLSSFYEWQVLYSANARIEHGFGEVDEVTEYIAVSVTSHKQYNEYGYRFYGTLYGKDEYNATIPVDYYITIYCEEQENDSCLVDFGGLSIRED